MLSSVCHLPTIPPHHQQARGPLRLVSGYLQQRLLSCHLEIHTRQGSKQCDKEATCCVDVPCTCAVCLDGATTSNMAKTCGSYYLTSTCNKSLPSPSTNAAIKCTNTHSRPAALAREELKPQVRCCNRLWSLGLLITSPFIQAAWRSHQPRA